MPCLPDGSPMRRYAHGNGVLPPLNNCSGSIHWCTEPTQTHGGGHINGPPPPGNPSALAVGPAARLPTHC